MRLFFGLRSETLEIGNILGVGQRNWPEFAAIVRKSELRRLTQLSKAHIWRAFLAGRTVFSKTRTAWLRTQSVASRSPVQIPANRGINREFCRKPPLGCNTCSQSSGKFNRLRVISLRDETGNFQTICREDLSTNRVIFDWRRQFMSG